MSEAPFTGLRRAMRGRPRCRIHRTRPFCPRTSRRKPALRGRCRQHPGRRRPFFRCRTGPPRPRRIRAAFDRPAAGGAVTFTQPAQSTARLDSFRQFNRKKCSSQWVLTIACTLPSVKPIWHHARLSHRKILRCERRQVPMIMAPRQGNPGSRGIYNAAKNRSKFSMTLVLSFSATFGSTLRGFQRASISGLSCRMPC